MAQLRLKQIAGPVDDKVGGVVVYDLGKPRWSTDVNTAITIPVGTTAERPQAPTPGMLRFNTDTEKLESYSDTWQAIASAKFIQSDDGSTFVDIERAGFENAVALGSFSKEVLLVKGSDTDAIAGEKLTITHTTDEVQLVANNTATTGDVDIRLRPQNDGHVFFGDFGDGLVESELTFDLTVRGGSSDGVSAPGTLTLVGGIASTGNFDGGNVVVKPGTASGTGAPGSVIIADADDASILTFSSVSETANNFMEIKNGESDVDLLINGIKIGAAAGSVSANVDIYLDPKGAGLVRVADYATYSASLLQAGGSDALVTKGYVLSLAGLGEGEENTIIAGAGLTDDNGVWNVNVGAATVGIDGVGNLIVKSDATAGHILQSTGTAGEQAVWGALDLSSAASFSGVLGSANGGLGFSTYAGGDLLVGNAGSTLDRLSVGLAKQALYSTGTSLAYGYVGELSDTNGVTALLAKATTDATNYAFVQNSPVDGAVEIGVEGTDTNVSLLLSTKGTGLILAESGYTANIGSNVETIVTKGFVDAAVAAGGDPLSRRIAISSGWSSEMTLGTALPNPAGRNVYIDRAVIRTISPISGGGATQAKIMSGTDTVTDLYESDLLTLGSYLVDLPEAFASTNTQLVMQFFAADGTTVATPTSGSIEITILYRIR